MIVRRCTTCGATIAKGATCIKHPKAAISMADTHYSYLPVDVGFDLRLRADVVCVPYDATEASYMTGAVPTRIEGSAFEIAQRMRDAGYRAKVGR